MDKKEIDAKKKEMVDQLRKDIEESILENFVERYEEWQDKLRSVNAVILHVDPTISPYEYNEFCKKIIEITKNSLDKVVDYDKLFLTSSEYFRLLLESDHDADKMEKAMAVELHRKFMDNLMLVLNKEHLKESVRHKLKENFSLVEEELDKSLVIAQSIIKKHEEGSSDE